jgi:hypothetical protein
MNTIYQPTFYNQSAKTQVDLGYDGTTVTPLGTFAGTIYKTLYRSNEHFVPSDTSEQLIADGLKPFTSVARNPRQN